MHEEAVGNTTANNEVTWKEYYVVRNQCHMLRKYFFKSAIDKTLYRLKLCKTEGYTPIHKKLIRTALRDAWFGVLGKHKIYKPGWSEKS